VECIESFLFLPLAVFSNKLVQNNKWFFHNLYDPGNKLTDRSPTIILACTNLATSF